MDFWNPRVLDMEDRLNAAIWAQSPAVQELIQPYRSDWEVGEVGAQQAMHAPSRLPWVPDIVGQEWRSPSAVAVIGSAYGPFIRNAHGSHEMSVHDYDCAAVSDFQDRFVRQVVGTRTYYAKVAALLGHILPDASHLALFDLCRVAFVRCGNPRDSGGDGVVNSAHELFSRYVEDSVPRNWLWRRLNESEAGTIVALGTVAEHGVLRLLAATSRMPNSWTPSIRGFPFQPHPESGGRRDTHTATGHSSRGGFTRAPRVGLFRVSPRGGSVDRGAWPWSLIPQEPVGLLATTLLAPSRTRTARTSAPETRAPNVCWSCQGAMEAAPPALHLMKCPCSSTRATPPSPVASAFSLSSAPPPPAASYRASPTHARCSPRSRPSFAAFIDL